MANVNHLRRGETLNRSVRMSKETWELVKERAHEDGVSVNYVIEAIATAYAQRQINVPTIKTVFD